MFKDYYQILGIPFDSSKEEIKQAYRKMSLKWHPDRNSNVDVTEIMQCINEAYKILKDDNSRAKYDKEYLRFNQQRKEQYEKQRNSSTTSWIYDYEVHDEDLKNDINEARAYAENLVDEFLKSFRETLKLAGKGARDGAYVYIIGGVIATIIFALIRLCH